MRGDDLSRENQLKTLLLVFGGLFLLAMILPWSTTRADKSVFVWDMWKGDSKAKLYFLSIGIGGLVALVLGATPQSARTRALGAVAIGLTPLIIIFAGGARQFDDWRFIAMFGGIALGALGLVWAHQDPDNTQAPAIVGVAALAIFVAYVAPKHDVSLVEAVWKVLKEDRIPTRFKLNQLLSLLPLALAVIAGLFVWQRQVRRDAGGLLAWLFLAAFPIASVSQYLVMAIDRPKFMPKPALAMVFHVPVLLTGMFAFIAFGGVWLLRHRGQPGR